MMLNPRNGTVQLCKKDEPMGTDRTVTKYSDNNINIFHSGACTHVASSHG